MTLTLCAFEQGSSPFHCVSIKLVSNQQVLNHMQHLRQVSGDNTYFGGILSIEAENWGGRRNKGSRIAGAQSKPSISFFPIPKHFKGLTQLN